MTHARRALRREDGSIPMALLAVIIVSGLMAVLFVRILSAQNQVEFDRNFTGALPVADAGVGLSLFHLNADMELTSADDGVTYERRDFPIGHSTVPEVRNLNGEDYVVSITRVSQASWVADSQAAMRGVDRRVVAEINEQPSEFLAAFTDDLLVFRGSNVADSYNSRTGAWCTGFGVIGSNDNVEFSGGSTSSTDCPRPTGRTVDEVHLYDWAGNPGAGTTGPYPGGSRCDPNGSGGAQNNHANCRRINDDFPAPELIDRKLDLATDDAVAFISDALDTCGGSLPDFRSSIDGTVLTPAANAEEAAASGNMGLAGAFHCYENMYFDEHTALATSATRDNPVIVFVRGEVVVTGGGGPNASHVGCVDCVAGPGGDTPDAGALRIFVLDGNINLGNHAKFAGIMYGPRAACGGTGSNAQAEIFGSVVCSTISNAGGWVFHFDDALASIGTGEFAVARWREEIPE